MDFPRLLGLGQVLLLFVLAAALLYLDYALNLPAAWHSAIMMVIAVGVAGVADGWIRRRAER